MGDPQSMRRCIWRTYGLPANDQESLAQRRARDLDEAVQGMVQLENQEDRPRHRAGADEEDNDDRHVPRGEEAETAEEHREPEDEQHYEGRGQRVLCLFDEHPARLPDVAHHLLRLGEDLPMRVVARGEGPEAVLHEPVLSTLLDGP